MHRLHLCTSASWYIFLAKKKAGAKGECQQQVLQTKTCRRVVQDFPTESFTLRHIGIWWTQRGACPSSGMRWYSMRLPYLKKIEKACLSAVYIIWHFLYLPSLPSFLALQFVSLLLDLCRCRSPGRPLCRSQNPASGWSEQSDPAVIFQSPPSAKNAFKAGFQGSKSLNLAVLNPASLIFAHILRIVEGLACFISFFFLWSFPSLVFLKCHFDIFIWLASSKWLQTQRTVGLKIVRHQNEGTNTKIMTTFGFGILSVHAGKHSRLVFHASGSCSKSPSSVSCSCTWINVKVHTLHVLASVIISGTHKPNTWLSQISKPQNSPSRQVIAICSTFKRGVDLLFFFKAAWWREDHPPSPPILTPWKCHPFHPPPVPVPSYCSPSQEHLVQRPRENVNDTFLQWARHIYMKPS